MLNDGQQQNRSHVLQRHAKKQVNRALRGVGMVTVPEEAKKPEN